MCPRKSQGRGSIYITRLSRSKFAGDLAMVECFWRGEKWRVVVITHTGEIISLGGCKYWGERDRSVKGLNSYLLGYGMRDFEIV